MKDERQIITLDYVNHRGERGARRVVPEYLWWGVTAWHPEEGWLMHAFDVEKGAYRDFAWSGILGPGDSIREELVAKVRIDDSPEERQRRAQAAASRAMTSDETIVATFAFWCWLDGQTEALEPDDVKRKYIGLGLLDGRRP